MKKVVMISVALCLLMFVVVSMSFADDMAKSTTVNGWISDSQCGAKGANAAAADCTKKCLEKGAKMVVVTDGDQKILMVENPEALKGHEGHHVAITGHVTADSVHIESVKMM